MADEQAKKSGVEELVADVEAYIDEWFQAKLPFNFQGGVRWTPSTDVFETDADYQIIMALPGLKTEDIQVQLDDDVLRVRGARGEVCEARGRYIKMEIPVGSFERRVRLPRSIRADEIAVRYEDGLLRVTVPKAAPVDVPIESQ